MTDDLSAAWAEIRARMLTVARPDSRFDMDLDSFIPAFPGIEAASSAAAATEMFQAARTLFVTPDNAMQPLRRLALAAGKTIVMPTYGLRRGFLSLGPANVDPALALYASWGDGAEHFGAFVPIAEVSAIGPLDLCLVGAATVTTAGRRFGMGHRYFDVEWNILRAAGLVSDATQSWTVVHAYQVLEGAAAGGMDEVGVDQIFTPSRTISSPQPLRPSRLRPETLGLLFGDAPPEAVAEAVRLAPGA